jgi:hypothetical protein
MRAAVAMRTATDFMHSFKLAIRHPSTGGFKRMMYQLC